jgi:hypothetical protein
VICLATPRWSTPIIVGTSWPIAFIVWWLLWQWKAQSPSSSARKSICRICPTATSVVTSYWRLLFGVGPPSVPVTRNSCPCRWIGWFVIVRLPMRMRTLSMWLTTSGSMPGKMRLFQLHRLKSSIVMIFGV